MEQVAGFFWRSLVKPIRDGGDGQFSGLYHPPSLATCVRVHAGWPIWPGLVGVLLRAAGQGRDERRALRMFVLRVTVSGPDECTRCDEHAEEQTRQEREGSFHGARL